MTKRKTEKTDDVLELERAVMSVLWAHPTVASLDQFRQLFSEHLATTCLYDEFQVELALRSLDRGDLEFPESITFAPPPPVSPPART